MQINITMVYSLNIVQKAEILSKHGQNLADENTCKIKPRSPITDLCSNAVSLSVKSECGPAMVWALPTGAGLMEVIDCHHYISETPLEANTHIIHFG